MTRRTPAPLGLVLALSLSLGLTSCSDDAEPAASPADPASSSGRPERYAVTLEVLEPPSPSGSPPGAPSDAPSDPSSSSPAPTGPTRVEVTNTGAKKDDFILRLMPPGAGLVRPESFQLAPGESTVVSVSVAGLAPDEQLVLIAVSRGEGEQLAELELPSPERP